MNNDYITTKSYPVSGIPDEEEANSLIQQLQTVNGVQKVSFNAGDRLVEITFDEKTTDDRTIRTILDRYRHTVMNPNGPVE